MQSPNWVCSKPAVIDLTVVSPLGSTHIVEAGTTAGSAALSGEGRKHANNDLKCTELNWVCVPMAMWRYIRSGYATCLHYHLLWPETSPL